MPLLFSFQNSPDILMILQDDGERLEQLESLKQIVDQYVAVSQDHERDLEKSNSTKKVLLLIISMFLAQSLLFSIRFPVKS